MTQLDKIFDSLDTLLKKSVAETKLEFYVFSNRESEVKEQINIQPTEISRDGNTCYVDVILILTRDAKVEKAPLALANKIVEINELFAHKVNKALDGHATSISHKEPTKILNPEPSSKETQAVFNLRITYLNKS
jgi:hypothetical protein